MRGQSGHHTQPHVRLTPSFMDMDDWFTSKLIGDFISKLRGSLMCLDNFLTCYPWVLYNQAQEDVRSTGAGTKCL